MGKYKQEVRTLSPTLAGKLLERLPEHSRSIKRTNVDRLAKDIENGKWLFTGEPIIISDKGELLDGAHRCHAVVQAKKSIKVAVVSGIPASIA